MKEHGPDPQIAESMAPERTDVEIFSFIVRIRKRSTPAASDYRGWVEHVQSGERTSFLGLDHLLPIIVKHVTSSPGEGETAKDPDASASLGDEEDSSGKRGA